MARLLNQLEVSTAEKFTVLFDAIHPLMEPLVPKEIRGVGFAVYIER